MIRFVLNDIALVPEVTSVALSSNVISLEFEYSALSLIAIERFSGGVVSSIMVSNTGSATFPVLSCALKYTIFSPSPTGKFRGRIMVNGSHSNHSVPSVLNDTLEIRVPKYFRLDVRFLR